MNYRNIIAILICISYTLTSCEDSEKNDILITKPVKQDLNIQIDTLNIPISEKELNNYQIYTLDESNGLFYGYNRFTHKINSFSLLSESKLESYKFHKEGPEKIIDIQGILKISDDTLVILSQYNLHFYDLKTQLIDKSIVINSAYDDVFFETNFINTTNNSQFFHDPNSNRLYFTITNIKEGLYQFKSKYYDNTILGFFSLENNSFNLLEKVKYPREYIENFYGFNEEIFFNLNHDGNINYNFSGLPYLYQFKPKDNIVSKYEVSGTNLPNLSLNTLNWNDVTAEDKKLKHFIRNSNFNRILKSKNFKFLFYRSALPEHIQSYKDLSKKDKVLTVLSSNFNFIENIELNGNFAMKRSSNIDNKLFIPIVDYKENFLSFLTISIINNK